MKNIFKYIPMVTLGQILGTVVGFPLLCFLINTLIPQHNFLREIQVPEKQSPQKG